MCISFDRAAVQPPSPKHRTPRAPAGRPAASSPRTACGRAGGARRALSVVATGLGRPTTGVIVIAAFLSCRHRRAAVQSSNTVRRRRIAGDSRCTSIARAMRSPLRWVASKTGVVAIQRRRLCCRRISVRDEASTAPGVARIALPALEAGTTLRTRCDRSCAVQRRDLRGSRPALNASMRASAIDAAYAPPAARQHRGGGEGVRGLARRSVIRRRPR